MQCPYCEPQHPCQRCIDRVDTCAETVMSMTHHKVWVEDNKVLVANDDDAFYVERLSSRAEVDSLIARLAAAREEAFPPAAEGAALPSLHPTR